MPTYYDDVRCYSLTTGDGSLTVGSKVPGFRTFDEANVPDGTEVRYKIFNGLQKEIGLGTYTDGVLSRDTVEMSSNGGLKIEVGLNAIIAIVFSAEDINAVVEAAETIDVSVAAVAASAAAASASQTAAAASAAAAAASAASVPSIDTDATLAANSDTVVPSQKAVKTYVDGIATNLGKRQRVRAATTANITIATALNNGDTLDGISLVTGDLVLVKDQSAPAENGIYTVGTSPARTTQFDTYNEHPGAMVSAAEGTVNADTLWLCTSNDGGTLNTTAIAFSRLVIAGELLASNNLSDLANAGTARTNLGLGTGDSPQFTAINVGNATDTTVSRDSAGVIAVEGVSLNSNIPLSSKSAAYTTVLSDANKGILHPAADANARTFTIDSNANVAYPVGTWLFFINETSQVVSIAITSDTLTLAGSTTTGTRSLAQNGYAFALKVTSTKWVISGPGLT